MKIKNLIAKYGAALTLTFSGYNLLLHLRTKRILEID